MGSLNTLEEDNGEGGKDSESKLKEIGVGKGALCQPSSIIWLYLES